MSYFHIFYIFKMHIERIYRLLQFNSRIMDIFYMKILAFKKPFRLISEITSLIFFHIFIYKTNNGKCIMIKIEFKIK